MNTYNTHGGKGPSAASKMHAANNPWLSFVKDFRATNGNAPLKVISEAYKSTRRPVQGPMRPPAGYKKASRGQLTVLKRQSAAELAHNFKSGSVSHLKSLAKTLGHKLSVKGKPLNKKQLQELLM